MFKIKKEMTEIEEIINESEDLKIEPKIEDLLKTEGLPKTESLPKNGSEELRERLIGIAVAGKSKEYLGKSITSEEIERLDREAILKLYARPNHWSGLRNQCETMEKHPKCYQLVQINR